MGVIGIVGTVKGGFIVRSDDDRSTWSISDPLFRGWKVTATARTDEGRYIVATASDVYGPALHVSDDLETWRQIEHGPAWPKELDRKLNQVWKIVPAGDRIWAGVDDAGLFVSHDSGETWQSVTALNEHETRSAWCPGLGGLCAHSILVDPNDSQRIWCGISAVGVFRSEDGGTSWQTCNEGVPVVIEDETCKDIGRCVHALAADPDNADIIYRRDHVGMFRSKDGGDSWERNESGLASWFGFPLSLDRATRDLYCVPLESDEYRIPKDGCLEVYASRDGGDTWQSQSAGLPATHAYMGVLRGAMDVDHMSPCGVYFGTTAGTLYVSNDAGGSWQTIEAIFPRVLSVDVYREES